MDEKKASMLAKLLNGRVWNSGGDIYLVLIERQDGKIVAVSDEVICEYKDEEALMTASNPKAIKSIYLI